MRISKLLLLITMVMPGVSFAHINRSESVLRHLVGHGAEVLVVFLCAAAAFVGYHYLRNSS